MAQFNLNWYNARVLTNPDATAQRASYRQKSVGGAFISAGFTPANDLPIYASTVRSPVLTDNVIWQFKIQAICTDNGPTDNDNGLIEGLKFACLSEAVVPDKTQVTSSFNLAGTDITKVGFILKKQSDNSIVEANVIVPRSGNGVSHTTTGLTPSTGYYYTYIYYATVNGVEVASDTYAAGITCNGANFNTLADVCIPLTGVSASSMEI